MKFLLTISILLLAGLAGASAQSSLLLIDGETSEPVSGATVTILLPGTETADPVRRTFRSDRGGKVEFRANGPAFVTVEHLSYETALDTIRGDGPHRILLQPRDYEAEPIVVTGQFRPSESDESLYQVRVISKEDIEAGGSQNLHDLMQSEMNVRVSRDNILGSGLSIQGMSGQNVKILIDGVPVVGRVGGNIDISQILLDNVERVEIVEGPLAVTYGTDALGGVVNIITDKRVRSSIEGDVNLHTESVGTYDIDGRLGLLIGNARISLSGGRYFFGGFARPDTSRFKEWKPREQYFADLNAAFYAGEFTFDYSGRYFHEFILNRGVPRAPYGETAFDDKYRTNRITNTLRARGEFGSGDVDLSASLSNYRRRKNTSIKNLVTLDEQLTASPQDQDTSGFDSWNFRGTYSRALTTLPLAWQAGFDFNLDRATGDRLDSGERSLGDYAMFVSARYSPVEHIALQPGLRYSHNTEYAAPVVPSINVRYAPSRSITLRAGYGRGFRAPSLRDLYFLFVDINHNIAGNADLRAEVSDNVNASATWSGEFKGSRLEITGTGYYNDVKNLITLANVRDDLYSYENIGTYRTTGAGLTGEYRARRISGTLGGAVTGRYNGLTETQEGVPTFSFSPELSAGGRWQIPGFAEWALDYKYTGRLPSYSVDADGDISEQFVDDYHMLNSTLSRDFLDDLLTIRIGVRNLFDITDVAANAEGDGTHNAGSTSIPVSWGRTFIADMSISLR